jgi:transcriptional regulator with XRE-family HTH domain
MTHGDTMTGRLTAIGEFLRFFRRKLDLNQSAVAERVGVTKNTVSQIERGKQWPSMQTYLRFLDVLDLPGYDITDPHRVEGEFRRAEALRDLGLMEWYASLNDEELRYGMVRAWEGVELMREMERRGLEHPFKRVGRAPLKLLAPEEIAERTNRASQGFQSGGGASQNFDI